MKKNNIISDWLDQYGDPEIDSFVEKKLSKLMKLDNISIKEQLEIILSAIESTSRKGIRTYYYSEYLLHKENRIKLRELGYVVKDHNDFISISW